MQRVPVTEKRGRRHSSEIVVSAIPDGQSQQAEIDPNDVRVDTYRDSGPGGQHRNTTDSAVRLTHKPTGIVVTAAEERSQYRNRQAAWQRLQVALAAAETTAHAAAANDVRSATFGRGPLVHVDGLARSGEVPRRNGADVPRPSWTVGPAAQIARRGLT